MVIRSFLLEMILRATDQASPVLRVNTALLKGMTEQTEKFNATVARTPALREASATMARIGTGAIVAGGALAYGVKAFVDQAAAVDAAGQHLITALDAGAAGQREYTQSMEFA